MEHITSKDGTKIAYQKSGNGPTLVLVHGTTIDYTQWTNLTPKLSQHFTVYAVDRRGRGQSGDTQPYALQRESEDLAALIESIPENVSLLGHSYGALCSLETALLTTHVNKLVLYEPPIYVTFKFAYPQGMLEKIDELVKTGNAQEALLFLYKMAGTRTNELELLRSLHSWQSRIAAANTIVRELIGVQEYSFDANRFKNLKTQILLLHGGDSQPFYKDAIETLSQSLPCSKMAVLSGQQHEAIDVAPELFLQNVGNFLQQI
jgi:pimeloyl-ACP methyl ester carboxylesterase